ncbi:DUF2316 family protein [Corynebacterium rhinophilum]|uniref:DUF2316 family protein n=1 Tax=Corynebacterium rhinophilum TaxID=3050197 RepID=UPI0025506391|nr:DUF2316 family protein [Corynebacterium sp. MSK082]MDK8647398.1 DUF2316 family protein [Corynebacterium sp. MSK082]
MSLNPAETAATSRELHALRGSLPLADAPINSSLGYQAGGLAEVLDIEASPIEVWRTRDYLVALAERQGIEVPPFSRLSDFMRPQAQKWFGRWEVPAV